jgi:hypothetical protein
MWNFLASPEATIANVNFIQNLPVLLSGLIGILWLSAGMLVCVTISHYVTQRTLSRVETASAPVGPSEAAQQLVLSSLNQ